MISVGFIGFGRMGSALANGAVAAQVLKKKQIFVYDTDLNVRRSGKRAGFYAVPDLGNLVSRCGLIFLCVKPQIMDSVLEQIRIHLNSIRNKNKCFVSIAAGIPLDRIKKKLGEGVSLFRVMPNTPALLSAGMSAVSKGSGATSSQKKLVENILSGVGEVVDVPESFMDAVTAISGSGPAYVFYLAECLINGAASLGLGPELSRRLVHQTLYGSGLMLKHRLEPAEELRRQVTSPGGTTAAAIEEFENKNFKKIVKAAVVKAARRSSALAKI